MKIAKNARDWFETGTLSGTRNLALANVLARQPEPQSDEERCKARGANEERCKRQPASRTSPTALRQQPLDDCV